MSLWDKITTYLSDMQNLRKVILIFIGMIFLGGIVLFNSDIQKLLQRPWPSSAAGDGSELDWTTDTASLSMGRSNAKMIDVVDSSGTRWLYAIGGVNKVLDDLDRDPRLPAPLDGYRINLMKSVERIKLDDNGTIDENDGGWHTVASMNFGHAEFGLIEQGGYIYVIAGDIHLTKTNFDPEEYDPDTPEAYDSPLLYSTIEKLDINNAEENKGNITAFADGGIDLVTVTVVNHGLSEGGIITITGTFNYNGSHVISNVTADTFDITAVWVETATGFWSENKWEIPALLSGVNFYPEVTEYQDKIHIVGGVFGNPFNSGVYNMWGGYSGQDPLVVKDDLTDWDTFGFDNKPVIGDAPISIPGGGDGGIIMGSLNEPSHFAYSDDPLNSGVVVQGLGDDQPPQGWPWEWPWYNPWIEDNPWVNLSHLWSQMLLNGEFYTTVSEHYILDLSDGELDESDYWVGELGVDYNASEELLEQSPDDLWRYSNLDLVYQRVFKVGHLRLYLTSYGYCGENMQGDLVWSSFPVIVSPPQGRYGHKLIVHKYDDNLDEDDDLLVVGGASWSTPMVKIWCHLVGSNCYGGVNCSVNVQYTFWVNDDDFNPFKLPDTGIPPEAYKYIGNIAYKWRSGTLNSTLEWDGTNANNASFTNTGQFIDGSSTRKLDDQYALALSGSGEHKGRAFFGMAQLDFSGGDNIFGKNAFVATGGLQNTGEIEGIGIPPSTINYQPISVTNRVERLETPYVGWESDLLPWVEEDSLSTYNLSSVGIDNYRSISFDGQIKFQDAEPTFNSPLNIHVPDYTGLANKLTQMFNNMEWFSMPDPDDLEGSALSRHSHSAIRSVRTVKDGIVTVYIYKAGGASGANPGWLPIVDNSVQVLGPFFYGTPGEVNPGNSTFTVEPQEVAGDGTAYAIATVTLRDYYNDPVVGKHVLPFDYQYLGMGDKEIRVESFGTADGGVGDPPDDPFTTTDSYLRTSSEGMAQFKLFYDGDFEDLIYETQIYMAYYPDAPAGSPLPNSEGSLGPEPLSYIKDGVPFDTFSTITAVPYKVAVDGVSTSTITLTLRDGSNLPVPGYRVDVNSSRNDQDIIDTIVPDPAYEDPENEEEYITDVNGEVIFYISSSTKGVARIHGAYEHQELPDTWIDLTSFARVEFAGYIDGLFPSQAAQGDKLAWMLITGAQTEWESESTTVEFIQPDDISFYKPLTGGGIGDVEEIRVVADGYSATVIGVRAIGHEGKDITFNMIDGDGVLRYGVNYGSEITATIDDEGKALFEYIAGVTPGIIKIGATIEGGDPWADLWFIQDQATVNPYDLEIYADPLMLEPGDSISSINVRVYRLANGEKVLIDYDPTINFDFVVDDSGSMDPENLDVDEYGIARSAYTKDLNPGKARIFVSTTYQGLYIAEKVIISKIAEFSEIPPIHPDSMIIDSNTSITLGGDANRDPEGEEFVHIASDAKVGIWTVRVITTTGIVSPGFDNKPMIEEHPFTVFPAGYSTGPELDIEPRQGLRGTDSMTVVIYGEDTLFFDDATTIRFEPVSGFDQDKIQILETRIFSPELAEVDIAIDYDTDPGYWDVVAITDLGGGGLQTAKTPPDKRFLVTDDNDYYVDVYSNRAELPRDGEAQAVITVFVGELDPLYGLGVGLGNVDVIMSIDDDGTILPVELTTDDEGYASTLYTVDTGIENSWVTITATAEPEDGIFQQGWKELYKVVYPYYGFTLDADPKALALKGIQTSKLTVAGLPEDDNGIPVTFHFASNSRGNIEPSSKSTTTGSAISTPGYIAAPEDSRIPEVVEIFAKAVVPGYGQIMSNVAAIQIGLDPDKYVLTLVANPEDVLAGGDIRSTVTAKLAYQYAPVPDWPINFEIIQPGTGDYLTDLRVRTGLTNGEAETEFVPGNSSGAVYIRARPLGLNIVKEVAITKQIDPDVDTDLSTISAVPRYVPTSDNGEDFSVVTVTLRNINYVPLPGLQVTLTTDREADLITLADGTSNHVTYTDYRGRAIFHVGSPQTGFSAVTATLADGVEFGTEIIFEEPGSLIWHNLQVRVPFQARDYDNEVWIYFTEDELDYPVFVNEVYYKNPGSHPVATRDLVQELYNIKMYLHPNATYTMWAKGRYHKARIIDSKITGSIGGSNLPFEFEELLIGDLLPISSALYKRPAPNEKQNLPTPYHDNYINTIDLPPIYNSWFENAYLPDFLRDFIVNSIDFNYWVSNYGPGIKGGPPPIYN